MGLQVSVPSQLLILKCLCLLLHKAIHYLHNLLNPLYHLVSKHKLFLNLQLLNLPVLIRYLRL